MRKLFLIAGTAILMSTPALAGSSTLSKGSEKLALWCDGSGCYTAPKLSAFKKGPKTRIGTGGASNYAKHKKALKAKGWE